MCMQVEELDMHPAMLREPICLLYESRVKKILCGKMLLKMGFCICLMLCVCYLEITLKVLNMPRVN
jgi:hypothetical protein